MTDIEKIHWVYDNLEDEESKEIFLNRLLYNITADTKYIDNMVSIYFKRMQREFHKYTEMVKVLREQLKHHKVVVYGMGNCGFVTLALFSSAMKDIEIAGFCDQWANEENDYHGYKQIRPEELAKNYKDAIIIVTPVDNKVKEEIVSDLIVKGFGKDQIIEKLPFRDYILRGQYFNELMIFDKEEVFIDAGCFNCGNDIEFIERCPNYKEIIAFEPDSVQYNNCAGISRAKGIKNFEIHNIGLWDKKEELFFSENGSCGKISEDGRSKIRVDTLDHVLNGKRASFIKMDIEGAELKALHGCKDTILTYHPKLAICVYHKLQDIIEIPLYIHEIAPEYKFYMRHHSQGQAETVLYAI